MNRDGTKSAIRWAVEIIGFLIVLGSIAVSYGRNEARTSENAELINRVDVANAAMHVKINDDVKGIYDLLYKQNGQIEKILGKLEYIDQRCNGK